jgi:glutamyl-tRNA reductase
MFVAVIGLSYRTAPIALRERLSCALSETPLDWRREDGRFAPIRELALIATCNRLELITALENVDSLPLLTALLAEQTGFAATDFADHLYHYAGETAAAHLCRVAAGLDSLALGEPQILGQVTASFTAATETKTIGPVLTELFRAAIRAGKRARAETAISQKATSLSAIAAAQAQSVVGDLDGRRHLVIGVGEMGQLALKALQARGATQIALANRTPSRAAALPAAQGLSVYGLDELATAVAQADVAIAAVSAQRPILTAAMLREIMPQRPDRPLLLIDLGLPRNVDPAVSQLPGVCLWNADELQGHLDEALAARQQEIPRVEAIVAAESDAFMAALRQLEIRPVISDMRHKAEAIRQRELARALRHLAGTDDDALINQLELFSRSLVNKLLHEPTRCLRHKAADDEAAAYAQAARDLFGLETSEQ